ncbi:Uncharacterised protein [Bordetella trematum]|uniref:Uncharacterized protein n=1 Tax=Bordetella trematum TaxID=123899 RepID=A0A157S6W7_9BORD|nr:Uncharacterised protein [Bordetella trematum]SUV96736.1 Uncharacterised protein [Bordetella trematum]
MTACGLSGFLAGPEINLGADGENREPSIHAGYSKLWGFYGAACCWSARKTRSGQGSTPIARTYPCSPFTWSAHPAASFPTSLSRRPRLSARPRHSPNTPIQSGPVASGRLLALVDAASRWASWRRSPSMRATAAARSRSDLTSCASTACRASTAPRRSASARSFSSCQPRSMASWRFSISTCLAAAPALYWAAPYQCRSASNPASSSAPTAAPMATARTDISASPLRADAPGPAAWCRRHTPSAAARGRPRPGRPRAAS